MRHKNPVPSIFTLGLCATFALAFAGAIQAQDKKAEPTGTWTWMRAAREGGQVKMTLKLKAEGDKLTGTLSSPRTQGREPVELELKNGKIKGDEISFTVSREVNGNSFKAVFAGKVTGDMIKGKLEIQRNSDTQSRDWEAKREIEKK